MPDFIISHIESEHKHLLHDIRVASGASAKEIVATVRKQYRGFDKTLQSKCENSDKYGVQLTPEALWLVLNEYAPELLEMSAPIVTDDPEPSADRPRKRRGDTHRLKRSICCRLEEDDYARLMAYIRDEGFDTVQSWLTYTVRKFIKTNN